MRRCYFLLLLLCCTLCGCARTTTAEQNAQSAANAEIAAAPRNGNLASYRLSPDALAKATHLEHTRAVLDIGGTLWGIVALWLLLQFGVIGGMQRAVTGRFRNRWVQGYLFLLMFVVATTLLSLPLDVYGQWLRRHYGLSVQGWGSWTGDQLKGMGIGWLFGGLLVMLLFYVIRRAPRRWWFVFWLCFIPITLFSVFATPYVSTLR